MDFSLTSQMVLKLSLLLSFRMIELIFKSLRLKMEEHFPHLQTPLLCLQAQDLGRPERMILPLKMTSLYMTPSQNK